MAIAGRYIDPRHGPHEPITGTPARRRGSVRRTSTVDAIRPNGLRRSLPGREARDLVTDPDGTPRRVAKPACELIWCMRVARSSKPQAAPTTDSRSEDVCRYPRGSEGSPSGDRPDATPIVDDDEVGWHEFAAELEADCMRRWRRHDLWRDDDGALIVDAFFRTAHMAPDGVETVIHEYAVQATIDPYEVRVVRCQADARVLPFQECPLAAQSAKRLAGMKVMTIAQVRAELAGSTTCTHLSDTLR